MRAKTVLTFPILLLSIVLAAQAPERINLEAVEKIKAEAAWQPQSMDIARILTNVYGARLTNSPSIRAAGEYARKKLLEWKLDDVHLEPWNFGNGWINEKFSIKVVSEPTLSLRAYPKAWTRGTNKPITAEAVEAFIRNESDFERLRGNLRGKLVMIEPPPEPSQPPVNEQDRLQRYSDAELLAMLQLSTPAAAANRPARLTRERVTTFFFQEGVAAIIEPAPYENGALFAVTSTGEVNPWKKDLTTSKSPPQLAIAADQYTRIIEMIRKQTPVMLELDIRSTYLTQDPAAFNLVADIKGTDKADELVVLGAHLDSWHLGKGATDNAAGVAVVMEAMRILKTLGLPMRRTVRLGLWTGEEEGLLGSRAFIDKYFINRPIGQTRLGHAKLSAYFNVDNGAGAIRGVYMQGNTAIRPIFETFIGPLKSLGITTLSPQDTDGTDHLSFDSAGLPGFQFIQDPLDYDTHTHHSTLDTFDRLIAEDLNKNAAIVATFAYLTANRDELLPRKPLPRSIRPAGSPIP